MMDDGPVNESEALETIGRLIVEGRLEKGLRQRPFAELIEASTKTIATMESGTRMAWGTNQRKVESALGWRPGSIQHVIDNAAEIPKGSVTLASMREGAGEPTWQDLAAEDDMAQRGPVTRANLLTDEELLAELSYRFRNYKNVVDGQT